MLKKLLPFILFVLLFGTFYLAFQKQNIFEGAFNTDEPGIVIGSLNFHRNIIEEFKDAAVYAQPPLDLIIREKIYVPLGKLLGITNAYPEFFHRFLSLIWWVLPIGYFSFNLKDFSTKRKLVIILSLLLAISSEFMQYYLAESKHYSAIAASFLLMIIILFSDKVTINKQKYKFYLSSLLPPFLHIISFPYYFMLVIFFFYRLSKESDRKNRTNLLGPTIFYLIYFAFFITSYFYISKISSDWQHPDFHNINFSAINNYIKWTLDWIFYKTPFYIIFKLIPSMVKNNLLVIFGLSAIPAIAKLVNRLLNNARANPDVTSFFPITIFLVWPLTVAAVTYRSGMFRGERYSIAVLVIIFFYLAEKIVEAAYLINKKRYRVIIMTVIFVVVGSFLYPRIASAKFLPDRTDENIFFSQNKKLLNDGDNIVILDNGAYSTSVSLYAIIYNFDIKAELDYCQGPTFFADGKNILNYWIGSHPNKNIYLLTTGNNLVGFEPVWQNGILKLYKINKAIDSTNLCGDSNPPVGDCYIRCTKGSPVSADGRSIPGTAPHLDIYR